MHSSELESSNFPSQVNCATVMSSHPPEIDASRTASFSTSIVDDGNSGDAGARCCAPTYECDQSSWRRIVRNFTPSWFVVNMGTGIVSILLNTLPFNGRWIFYLSVVVWCINIILFCLFLFITILRYTFYPEIWPVMIKHPTQALFMGCFPMGFATIINMMILVCASKWGQWIVILAWAFWWIDAIISVAVCLLLPYIIMENNKINHLSQVTGAWLLPIVSCVVASATGGIVASALPNPQHALLTLIVSYILWGIGVPMALMVEGIYLHRLTIHKLPPREAIVSVFLPIGPLGQGGFGIQKLGAVSLEVFPKTNTLHPMAGQFLYVLGFFLGLIMWGFALVWLFFALVTIFRTKRFPFNMGWWGFTFPIGVFGTCTIQMGKDMPSKAFDVIATIVALSVVILWLMVTTKTVYSVMMGTAFTAPCLKDLGNLETVKESRV